MKLAKFSISNARTVLLDVIQTSLAGAAMTSYLPKWHGSRRRGFFTPCLLLLFFFSGAQADTQCYEWSLSPQWSGWFPSASAAADGHVAWCNASNANASACWGGDSNDICAQHVIECKFYVEKYPIVAEGRFPQYEDGRYIHVREYWIVPPGGLYTEYTQYNSVAYRSFPCEGFFIKAILNNSDCHICVADPINPATAAVFSRTNSLQGANRPLEFERYYNSNSAALQAGWTNHFGRTLKISYSTATYERYISSDPNNSGIYADQAEACTAGFLEIKGRVSTWDNAVPSYSAGMCTLSVGGTTIATLPVFSISQALPQPNASPVTFEATRDDGQLIRFTSQSEQVVTPPSINLKLQQTNTGYLLTDANDNAESYDTNGKLQSITNRSGIMQTMSYDSAGRLSGVTDNFGHSLSLSYDSQNRLLSVIRQ